jgi:hypothetical protein
MKLIIVTLIVLATLKFGYAQPVFGVKCGVNLNDVVVENAPFLPIHLYERNVGFNIGVFTQFNLIEKLALNTELQFIQKGANSDDIRINLNYLELPLLVSFTPIKMLSVEAGPGISYLISANAQHGTPNASDVFDKPFDFGLTAGIKIHATDKISIVCKYYYGLSSVRDFVNIYIDTTPTSANRNWQFGMSYSFSNSN